MCICSLDDSEKPCYKEAMRCSDRLSNTILYKSKMDKKCFLSQYAIPIAGELMHMVQNSYREREMQRGHPGRLMHYYTYFITRNPQQSNF